MKRPLFLLLLFSATVTAFAGCAFAKPSNEAISNDYRNLDALADIVISSENRLVIVTVRGEGERKAVQTMIAAVPGGGKASCEKGNSTCDFVLRFNVQGDQEASGSGSAVTQWIENAAKQLMNNGLTGTWNVNIQGYLPAGRALDTVWKNIETAAKATEVEAYEDAGSRSVAYHSSMFKSSVTSGGEKIGLQAAAHRSTETNEWRITLGTPVILIEY